MSILNTNHYIGMKSASHLANQENKSILAPFCGRHFSKYFGVQQWTKQMWSLHLKKLNILAICHLLFIMYCFNFYTQNDFTLRSSLVSSVSTYSFSCVTLKSRTNSSTTGELGQILTFGWEYYIASCLHLALLSLSVRWVESHVCFSYGSLRFSVEKRNSQGTDWAKRSRRRFRVREDSMGKLSQGCGGINARTTWVAEDCPCRLVLLLPLWSFSFLLDGKLCFPTKGKTPWTLVSVPSFDALWTYFGDSPRWQVKEKWGWEWDTPAPCNLGKISVNRKTNSAFSSALWT